MNSDDLLKVLAGGLVTLIGGALLHQLQLGGRRRRRRREIREQLELLAMLGEHPAVAARVRRRVEVALEQYEPTAETRRARLKRWLPTGSLAAATLATTPFIVMTDAGIDTPWRILGVATVAAATANALESLLSRGLSLREQDEAVDQVIEGGTAAERDRAILGNVSVTSPPE